MGLKDSGAMDLSASGCGAITAVVHDGFAVISNLGNARCVVGAVSTQGEIHPLQLTVDHTPGVGAERARIEAAGGQVVSSPREEQLSGQSCDRLLVPGEGEVEAEADPASPGSGGGGAGHSLPVSRAFGDWKAKECGLSAEPQVHTFPVVPAFKFLIIASDGIWDVLSNEEAVQIVAGKAKASQRAAGELVKAAAKKISAQRPWVKREDMCAVVLHLNTL